MRHVDLTYTLGIVLTMVLAELGFSVEAQLTDGKFVLQLREQVATTAGD